MRTSWWSVGTPLLPEGLLSFASGVNAMTIVVEIASRTGTRAFKEYDAPSVHAAMEAANRELQAYPQFRITGFWIDRWRVVQRQPQEDGGSAAAAVADASHGIT
jgi:hypothetical protein